MAYENIVYGDEHSQDKEELTHIQITVKDRDRIEKLKKKTGYGSAKVIVNKLLDKCAGKLT